MLEKLKRYYQGHIVTDTTPNNYEEYCWYTDEQDNTIGIEKKMLTKKDEELLSVFLTPVSDEELSISSEQHAWKRFLFQSAEDVHSIPFHGQMKTVRFLHFAMKESFFEKQALEEALQGLLSSSFIILWQTNKSGVIIETYPHVKPETELDFEAFDALTTDFLITPSILIGRLHLVQPSLLQQFHWEQACFQTAQSHLKKQHIYRLEDVLPYLFLEKQDVHLLPLLFGETQDDQELLTTVRTYLECNLNVSLAAKKQYMHRNSVQYRVDKFIERTGIDIKTFKGAVAVYMALLMQDSPS
ncbi:MULTISPECIES: PucR family transcriptional regulator [Bacillaceae]|uniref:PucR family transcriptional regulator n=1 Tax=Bacillaceae TaxID=186817 RepID=UPI00101DE23C|nr:helix-turn-helix domain-containing protein [Ectobacillus funiculus]